VSAPDPKSVNALVTLRHAAGEHIEREKARLRAHRGCCCADVVAAVLLVASLQHGVLLVGARLADQADIEPLLAGGDGLELLRSRARPGDVFVLVVSDGVALGLFAEPLAPLPSQPNAHATTAPGGSA